jgi:endoglucanase
VRRARTPLVIALGILASAVGTADARVEHPRADPAHRPHNLVRPSIRGDTTVGEQLKLRHGSWSPRVTRFRYQWERCNSAGKRCVAVHNATRKRYRLGGRDRGRRIAVVVAAHDKRGWTTATSKRTRRIRAAAPGAKSTAPGATSTAPGASQNPTGGAANPGGAGGSGSGSSPPSGAGPASGGGGTDGIKVVGTTLENGAGARIHLHGVDRSGTEYACVQGFGMTDGPGSTATNPTEFGPMQSWGINSVLIGLNEDCWLGINGAGISNWARDSGQNYINEIKAEVKQAEADGIYPVLALYWLAPGSNVASSHIPLTDNDHAPLFWEEVADTFKNDPDVIFRLEEEPTFWYAPEGNWQCWAKGDVQYSEMSVNQYGTAPTPSSNTLHCTGANPLYNNAYYAPVGMQSLVNIVRGTGATNVIQLPGLAYANDASCDPTQSPVSCGMLDSADGSMVTDPINQMMANFDMYPDTSQVCETLSCYQTEFAPIAKVMPVDLGETGYGGPQDNILLNYMDSIGQGNYYAFAWDTWSTLITSYSGTPMSPFGTFWKARLLAEGTG